MSSSSVRIDDINECDISRDSLSASVITLTDSNGKDEYAASTSDTSVESSSTPRTDLMVDVQSENMKSVEMLDIVPLEKDGTVVSSRINEKAKDANSNNDDDDITSKAAVALAAVAAAATANNKSPAEAAREARDLAHTFIAQATTVSDDKKANSIARSTGGFIPGTSSTSTSRNSQTIAQITLSDVKKQLKRRTKDTTSSFGTENFCSGYNDSFLKHLLLIEHYQCNDDSVENGEVTTTLCDDPNTNDFTSTSSQACDRLEAVLRRVEGAYDSLIDRLPAQTRNFQHKTNYTLSKNDDCDTFDEVVVVPDLLPPCISEKGDLTVAFFRACIGESINPPDSHRQVAATYGSDFAQAASSG